MAARLGNGLNVLTPLVVAGLATGFGMAEIGAPRMESAGPPRAASGPRSSQPPGDQDASDVLGANAACLVCHLTFVKEPLARSHQLQGVFCTKCHGASVAHANDEHIGATRPDVTYSRAKVDGACAVCHEEHDVPATKVIARFLERKLPAQPVVICTDCHGAHRIAKAATPPADPSPAGKQPKALLADPPGAAAPGRHGAYIDERHLTALAFGSHSHWLQPWRAYQETLPAQRFLDAQGVVLELPDARAADLIVTMLARHGVRNARIEINWGFVNYWDESKLNFTDRLKPLLLACKRHGVRPLILLNAHSGVPVPTDFSERALAREAKKGDRRVELADVSNLRAGYSGLANLSDYWASEALITDIDGTTVRLSKPLPKDLGKPGAKVVVTTLKYRPFSAPGTEDYRNTVAGWKRYVGTVADFVAETLGTQHAADRGFDLEIWNELTFGSLFLSINNYYEPKLVEYKDEEIWERLVRETAEFADRRPEQFRGVTLVDGFRNTIPWPSAAREPARVGAMSAHPYPPRKIYPRDDPRGPALDALFAEGRPAFTPAYSALFPEYHATALQTETVVRDMAPITTPIYDVPHGRNSRVIDGKTASCPLWFTEIGLHPKEHGVVDREAALRLKAKATARDACFFPAKGVERIYFFSALDGDTGYGLVSDHFVAYSRTGKPYPPDEAAYVSPALRALENIAGKMRDGLDPGLVASRQVTLASITDTHDHYQFRGDGSPRHPQLYDRDVFVFLPFQANRKRFVIPYYVMTRDITKDLAPEEFTIKIRGIDGRGATAVCYDPVTDRDLPLGIKSATAAELSLRLEAADYPYLLIIQER